MSDAAPPGLREVALQSTANMVRRYTLDFFRASPLEARLQECEDEGLLKAEEASPGLRLRRGSDLRMILVELATGHGSHLTFARTIFEGLATEHGYQLTLARRIVDGLFRGPIP